MSVKMFCGDWSRNSHRRGRRCRILASFSQQLRGNRSTTLGGWYRWGEEDSSLCVGSPPIPGRDEDGEDGEGERVERVEFTGRRPLAATGFSPFPMVRTVGVGGRGSWYQQCPLETPSTAIWWLALLDTGSPRWTLERTKDLGDQWLERKRGRYSVKLLNTDYWSLLWTKAYSGDIRTDTEWPTATRLKDCIRVNDYNLDDLARLSFHTRLPGGGADETVLPPSRQEYWKRSRIIVIYLSILSSFIFNVIENVKGGMRGRLAFFIPFFGVFCNLMQ